MSKCMSVAQTYKMIKSDMLKMSDKEFLALPSFYELVKTQVTAVSKDYNINVVCSSIDNDFTACTDGKMVQVNTWSPLILPLDTRYEKYISCIGSASHECGHVLYTDFSLLNPIRKDLCKGKYKFANSNELKEYPYDLISEFGNIMCDLINIIEDGYIENCLFASYPPEGILAKGLILGNKVKQKIGPDVNEVLSFADKKPMIKLMLFNYLTQMINVLGYEPNGLKKALSTNNKILKEVMDKVNETKPEVDKYINDSKSHEKVISKMAEIMFSLMPENKKSKDDEEGNGEQKNKNTSQNQSGSKSSSNESSESGSNDSSEQSSDESKSEENQSSNKEKSNESKSDKKDNSKKEDKSDKEESKGKEDSESANKAEKEELQKLDKIIDALKSTMTEVPEGRGKPMISNPNTKSGNNNKASASKKELVDQTGNLENDMAEEMAHKMVELMADENFRTECYSVNKDIFFPIVSHDKSSYNNYFEQVAKISKACQRKLKDILDKRSDEDFDDGFLMGSKFNARAVSNNDGKYFSREILPDEKPDVVFSVMIDQSGSMWGERIEKAKVAGILFEDLCTKLNIPVHIISHTTNRYGNRISISNCVNFENNKTEKYRIASLEAGGGNLDTDVLEILCEEITKRPEKQKVVIVISDGRPCTNSSRSSSENYRGLEFKSVLGTGWFSTTDFADRQLNTCVRYWRKKGVSVIGVALADYENIKNIYENCILDARDLNKLPNQLVKIFQRYVLK